MLDFNYFSALESCWERLKNADLPIFIYGMGDGCNKILAKFEELGIGCDGIFASDEFVRGHEFAGFKVQRYSEVLKDHKNFIIVPAFGTSLPDVMTRLENMAENHTLIMPDTPVIGSECFDKNQFLARFSQAEKVYNLLADDLSKQVFVSILSYKISGDISCLKQIFTSPDEAYDNILSLGGKETYVDLGAFTGDTVLEFLNHTKGSYNKIYALEPDKKNFRKCVANLLHLNNIELHNAASWKCDQLKAFCGNSGRQGKLSDEGKLTRCRSVDSILSGNDCTYIKFDVEGAEHESILGSIDTIKKYSPKICTALYHRAYDIIELPLLLHEINPDYRFFIRQYSYYPAWETNLFCIT